MWILAMVIGLYFLFTKKIKVSAKKEIVSPKTKIIGVMALIFAASEYLIKNSSDFLNAGYSSGDTHWMFYLQVIYGVVFIFTIFTLAQNKE